MDQKLTVGRIVHYVLPDGHHAGEHRPAVVVRVWDAPIPEGMGTVNLQVITDGSNDGPDYASGMVWVTSALQDEDTKAPRTWHWPERE